MINLDKNNLADDLEFEYNGFIVRHRNAHNIFVANKRSCTIRAQTEGLSSSILSQFEDMSIIIYTFAGYEN